MKITSATYVKSINGTDKILYDGKYQVAFVGRSNVGKSSLINALTGQDGLARSSKNPGKTIHLDFFLINNKFYFVDLPGYGFANRSEEQREKFRKMILWYLEYSEIKRRMVIVIIDANVGMTEFDQQMIEVLNEQHIQFVVIANKIDKLKMGEVVKQLRAIQKICPDAQVISHSIFNKSGRSEILRVIEERV